MVSVSLHNRETVTQAVSVLSADLLLLLVILRRGGCHVVSCAMTPVSQGTEGSLWLEVGSEHFHHSL